MSNPEIIEIHGLKTIHKLCNFAADRSMGGSTFTEIVERMFDEIERTKTPSIPKECLLVKESDIKTIWQDDEEPENIVNKETDFNVLGDCLDFEDIISITKQGFVNIYAEKVYGTWVGKLEDGVFKKDYFFVGTDKECEEVIAKNKSLFSSNQKDIK